MSLRVRDVVFAVVAAVAVSVFAALGVWQLGRHHERERADAGKRARRDLARVELTDGLLSLPAESLDWRRARASGRFDYGAEIILRSRAYNGIPGVYVVTPLVLSAGGRLPVLRGWLPAADGFDAPLPAGRPDPAFRDSAVTVEGIVIVPAEGDTPEVDSLHAGGRAHPVVAALDGATLERLFPEAAGRLYLHASAGTSTGAPSARSRGLALPRPLDPPTLEGGPHVTYAVQWFSFAAITLVGGGIFLVGRIRTRSGRAGTAAEPPAGQPPIRSSSSGGCSSV